MAYISELIGKPVADISGERIGVLTDVIATYQLEIHHPVVIAICVKYGKKEIVVPFSDVVVLIAPAVSLSKSIDNVIPCELAENDLHLVRDVLDKQIIDTNGIRVVRVNDIELARVNGTFFVANVDIGSLGLLRRLGLARMAQGFASRLRGGLSSTVIAWDHVELLDPDQPMRLKVPGEKIADLHPADLAEIISELNHTQTGKLLETLDAKTLADTLEEVETEFQASLIEDMPDEKVVDVLEEMSPDEAADLLAELPEDRSKELLKLMELDDAEDLRKLLAYPEDSAGGIMTTEYISVPPDLTAEQAIQVLREMAHEAETIFYVYVTDPQDHLLGVFSLSDLVLSQPDTPINSFMHKKSVRVHVNDSQDEVAQMIAKYNLLAIPVVNDDDQIQGIVTADDALDKIIPTAWKKRLPRLYY